ncbi:MAG: hypothetical protein U0Q16_27565 [Bryobacteraceae bacterium]
MLRTAAFLTALPLAAATVGETDRIIPLIHDGGGWSTQVTIVNLATKPAHIMAAFQTARGFQEAWKLTLTATQGKVDAATFEATLAPGAVTIVETSGAPTELTRGFADIIEFNDLPLGAFARLIKRENGQVVQSLTVPRSPAHESRSVVAIDLSDPANSHELIWVSPTTNTILDLTFRSDTGAVILTDQIAFTRSQIIANVLLEWPRLAGFRGTLEWKVSFPTADRYEERILAAASLWSRNGQSWASQNALTLPGDQRSPSPY